MTATLTRSVLGRLGSYGAVPIANVRSAFDTNDWTVQGAASASVSLLSNNLVVGISGNANGFAFAGNVTIGNVADSYIQATWVARLRANDEAGLLSRYQGNALDYLDFGVWGGGINRISEYVSGSAVQSASWAPETIPTVRFQMRTSGTTADGMPFSGNSSMPLTGIGLSTAGRVGLRYWNNNGINNNGNAHFGEFYATRNHLIKATSALASGWYIVVLDASSNVLAESTDAVAGVATINAYNRKLVLPLVATIEIRETASGLTLTSMSPSETVWPGDEWTFVPASGYVPPPTVSRLTRNTLGRLAAFVRLTAQAQDVNTLFALGNWTGYSTTGTTTPSIGTSGDLVLTTNAGSGNRGAYYNALSLPVDHCVMTSKLLQSTGGTSGSLARADAANPMVNGVFCTIPAGFSGTYSLFEIINGSTAAQATSATANRTTSATSEHMLWCNGTTATARQTSAGGTGVADSTLTVTTLNASTDGVTGGIYNGSSGANVFTYRAWAAMRSAVLRVTGPNSGTWQVRLRNATGTLLYTSASHTAGVVDINTLTEMTVLYSAGMPLMTQIEIYEPATSTVERGPELPSETLWGGDVWNWGVYVPPTPSGPPAARIAHRKAGAQQLLLKR